METIRIGVVIPAFNEADHLPGVLDVVSAVDWLTQIVVVDDGSTDDTLAVAQRYALRDPRASVVHLPQNQGKADAMLAGVQALQTDTVIFLDADLIGLQPHHLRHLSEPVIAGKCDMAVAVFRHGRIRTDLSHRLTPWLSGQRCLRRSTAERALRTLVGGRYGVEVGLTAYSGRHGWRRQYVVWPHLTHMVKEQKRGLFAGLRERWQMYAQIVTMLVMIGIGVAGGWLAFLNWPRVTQGLLSSHRSSYWRIVAAVLLLAVLVLWFGGHERSLAQVELHLRDLSTLQVEQYHRILIFAPHPDDEALASGGVIATALAAEPPPQIRVVVVTSGEASLSTALANGYNPASQRSTRRLAENRQRESLQALTSLGVDPEQIQFWGFPDGGLESIWLHHWTGDVPYRSRWTGLTSSEHAVNSPIVPYTGAALLDLLREALAEFQPDAVVMPHPQDAHPDHRALAYFISLAVSLNQAEGDSPAPDLFAYVMWLSFTPRPTNIRLDKDPLRLPARFNTDTEQWVRIPLTDTIRRQKVTALQSYRSQARTLRGLLRNAGGDNEVFARWLLEYQVPRFAATPLSLPDERWQPFPYEEEWKWPGMLQPAAPISLWTAADQTDLWLAAQLPHPPRKGVSYIFVVRTVHDHKPFEMRMPARDLVRTPDHKFFVVTKLPLEDLDRGVQGQVLMASLETRLMGGITATRGTWHLLYLTEGGQVP